MKFTKVSKNVTLTLRVTEDQAEKMDKFCLENETNPSIFVRTLIKNFFEEKNGNKKTVTFNQF